jgi:hypothetical protein
MQLNDRCWPKANMTVAWGNAPGLSHNWSILAEGHIQTELVVEPDEYGRWPKIFPPNLKS